MNVYCTLALLVFAIVNVIHVCAGHCIYPPCPSNDVQSQAELGLNAEECCLESKKELAELQRNVTALWFTVSDFREVVARHLHHLHQHQHQVFMSTHQTADQPLETHNHESTHHDPSDPHFRRDPFRGLNVQPQPQFAFRRNPTVRNPEDFDFAVCHMRPNSMVPHSQVQGVVYLWQKKNSSTLYLYLMMGGFKTRHHPAGAGDENPLPSLHGLHVHETADLSHGCESVGPHFNPLKTPHGGANSPLRHIGDFGNVVSDEEGIIHELITDELASLRGPRNILGRPLVVQAMLDLGSDPDDPETTSTGNFGPRLACCVIEGMVPEKNPRHQGHQKEEQILDQEVQRDL